MTILRLMIPALMLAVAACTPAPDEDPAELVESLPVSAGERPDGPRLLEGHDGRLVLSWAERLDSGGRLQFSVWDGAGWGAPRAVVSDPNMFVNWADTPGVTPRRDGGFFAWWPSKSAEETYAYDVLVAQSDDGVHWTPPARPHDDGTPTEHGFVSAWESGVSIGMVWLDGRKMIGEVTDDPSDTSMSLRFGFMASDGAHFGGVEIDGMVCECCRTDLAVGSAGPLLVYRNRSPENVREIHLARFVEGDWQPAEALSSDGWVIDGCPVNGPAIDAVGDTVATAWFNAPNDTPAVRARLSTDGGATFGDVLDIAGADARGQVDVIVSGDGSTIVSWLRDTGDALELRLRRIAADGSLGEAVTLAQTAYRRSVPQARRSGDALLLAWTDLVDEQTVLRSSRIPLAAIP